MFFNLNYHLISFFQAKLWEEIKVDVLIPYLDKLEMILRENGGDYFVGSHVNTSFFK